MTLSLTTATTPENIVRRLLRSRWPLLFDKALVGRRGRGMRDREGLSRLLGWH